LKKLFLVALFILFSASVLTYLKLPGVGREVPRLRWVIKESDIKNEQLVLFQEWLKENGYPEIEINLDTSNPNKDRNVVQGVSGVAGDILDCYEEQVQLYQSVGLLSDISDIASEMGFDASKTYPSVRDSMMVDGRQYAFPRNVGVLFNWINLDAFEKAGLPPPPDIWTFKEFEEIGRAFIENSNPPGERQTTYFCKPPSFKVRLIYLRSMGGDLYNETMTKSGLNNPLFEEIYEMTHRWTFALRIFPTAEESKNLSTATASGDAAMNLFAKGNYGLYNGARWGIMFFRELGPKNIAVSEYPHGGFRNTIVYYGGCAIYKGSKQKEIAPYFLKFLTSERFNLHVAASGDSLPPIPKYTETDAFLRPPQYPNEWGIHGRIRDIANDTSLPISSSLYILWDYVLRVEKKAIDKFFTNRSSAREAIQAMVKAINNEMQRKVSENPTLAKRYKQGLKDQAEIDRLRKKGELVPLHLISNPFYRKYYVEKGWSLPEGSSAVASLK
jgi:multiple sugar transport system substrate-binding protein